MKWLWPVLLACSVAGARTDWSRLPDLPDPLGVAGAYAGVSGDALLVAGGANFPHGFPWQGGKKVWHDTVWALPKPDGAWRQAGSLRRPLGYGVAVSDGQGLVCAGGSDVDGHYAEVFRLRWAGDRLTIDDLPPLPRPLANACGALVGKTLYVVGGSASPAATAALDTLYALDLGRAGARWTTLPPCPGGGRMLATAGVQGGALYVFGGVSLSAGPDGKPVRSYLREAWRFTPAGGWARLADLPHPLAASPSPAPALGQAHLLLLGGDDGSKVGFEPIDQHPGFNRDVLAYHTITGTWATLGSAGAARVTTTAVSWRGAFVVPSGEARPGVRSPEVWQVKPATQKVRFGLVNYVSLAFYPLIMLAISWWVGRKATSEEFFRGGQRIPWWAAGLSIYATMLSSITFMAIPAKSFTTDWAFILGNLTVPLLAPLVIAVYLPFYRQLDITSAYEYLERRFNLAARWFGSASFILLQLGRTAIVLYLPALALATVSNFPMQLCILIMGIICILMTFEGGLESVVWTDVAQTIILLAGALATVVVALHAVPGGASEVWRLAQQDGKILSQLRWTPQLTIATGWVILVGNIFGTMVSYTAGQDIVQRYVSTADSRQAARSIWVNALMVIPSSLLFFAVGTALYAFYKLHPARLDPTLANDAIFPLFIVNELPMGLGGLVVAGIFAAAQPTSSLNGIATAWITDFHDRLWPGLPDAARLRWAKIVTVASGVAGTLIALAMTLFDIASTWDAFLSLLGMTGGALSGLFMLGLFTRRAHGLGATLGALAGVVVLVLVRSYTSLHFLTYAPLGTLTCVAVGWLASLILPGKHKPLAGLTIYTTKEPSS